MAGPAWPADASLGRWQAYLDHAATTPMRPEAVAAMLPYLTEHFGNPSGSHAVARAARLAVDDARDEVAAVPRVRARARWCSPSGGTEADNLAVLGAHGAGRRRRACARPSSTTPCCIACAVAAGARPCPSTPPGSSTSTRWPRRLQPGVGLVSVMLANNEVGTVQPLAEVVAAGARPRAPGASVHTDAVAAVRWLDVAARARRRPTSCR